MADMFRSLYLIMFILSNQNISITSKSDDFLSNDVESKQKCLIESKCHYLTYDIDLYEGFNLRQDVYIRMASLVKSLGDNWSLVLPLWSSVSHWNNDNKLSFNGVKETNKWSTYFDVKSLNQFIKVTELDNLLNQNSNLIIDVVIALEPFIDTPENFNGQSWRSERFIINKCSRSKYFVLIDGKIKNLINDEKNITYKKLVCVQIDGYVSTLHEIIKKHFSDENNILISKAEMILHRDYGNKEYWLVRRSLRFSSKLINIANDFRRYFLNSNDLNDKTMMNMNWEIMKRSHGDAMGGNYLAVHLRRGDFINERFNDIPNTECAVMQIIFALSHFNISSNHVFISSDGSDNEWYNLFRLLSSKNVHIFPHISDTLSDGEKAIVDQWIASHAKVFIGTYDSNFSYRIHEEREILGFHINTTFNAFCAKCFDTQLISLCKQKTQWKMTNTIVYD